MYSRGFGSGRAWVTTLVCGLAIAAPACDDDSHIGERLYDASATGGSAATGGTGATGGTSGIGGMGGIGGIAGSDGGVGDVAMDANEAGRTSWSFVGDLVATANPHGAWSYGSTPTVGGTFAIFTNSEVNEPGTFEWNNGNAGSAHIWKNDTTGTITGVAPGQASLHPGQDNSLAVVRFTVPAAGSYKIDAQFFVGHVGDTDGHVRHNGTSLLTGAATGSSPTFSQTVSAVQGDVFDFAVGSLGHWAADNTPLTVTIAAQ